MVVAPLEKLSIPSISMSSFSGRVTASFLQTLETHPKQNPQLIELIDNPTPPAWVWVLSTLHYHDKSQVGSEIKKNPKAILTWAISNMRRF